jgi:hypothetical protein
MTSTQRRTYRAGDILGTTDGVCVVVTSDAESAEHLSCAGEPLAMMPPLPCGAAASDPGDSVRPGEILFDPATGLEVRCIRGGRGPLVHGGRAMVRRWPR